MTGVVQLQNSRLLSWCPAETHSGDTSRDRDSMEEVEIKMETASRMRILSRRYTFQDTVYPDCSSAGCNNNNNTDLYVHATELSTVSLYNQLELKREEMHFSDWVTTIACRALPALTAWLQASSSFASYLRLTSFLRRPFTIQHMRRTPINQTHSDSRTH